MSYNALPTVTTGDMWTSSEQNTYVRDNFSSGVPDIFTTKGDLAVASAANTAVRVPVGTDGQFLQADSTSGSGVSWVSPGSMSLISSQLLSGSATTITFSSIPDTYNHLKIVAVGRGTSAATSIETRLKFNNDAGGNYDYVYSTFKSVDTLACANTISGSYIKISEFSAGTAPAATETGFEATIPNYAGTVFQKSVNSIGAKRLAATTGNVYSILCSGFWKSTDAINRIDLTASAGAFAIASMFTLYGF
jgi:hypothetical protein